MEKAFTENKEDKVVVKKPAIKKIIRGNNSKKVKVIYEKVKGVSGYQIKYSTSKKFTKNTTKTITVKRIKRIVSKTDNVKKSIANTTKQKTTKKKTITKLKANTYYFKVRAYKIVNGKTYYSEWSKVRKTIVKKQLENNEKLPVRLKGPAGSFILKAIKIYQHFKESI